MTHARVAQMLPVLTSARLQERLYSAHGSRTSLLGYMRTQKASIGCEFESLSTCLVERSRRIRNRRVAQARVQLHMAGYSVIRFVACIGPALNSPMGRGLHPSSLPSWRGQTSSPVVQTAVPCFNFLVEADLLKTVCDNGAAFGTKIVQKIADANKRLLQSAKIN